MRHLSVLILTIIMFSVTASGQSASSLEDYERAVELISRSEYTDAVEILEEARERGSIDSSERSLRADIMFALGKARFLLNEFETAESDLEKSLSIRKTQHSETLYYLGLVQLHAEEPGKAVRFLNLAIRADAKNAEAWYELGSILLDRGSNARAKVAFEQALKLGSTRTDKARKGLALIKRELSSRSKAGNKLR